jgi:hypothetical protein
VRRAPAHGPTGQHAGFGGDARGCFVRSWPAVLVKHLELFCAGGAGARLSARGARFVCEDVGCSPTSFRSPGQLQYWWTTVTPSAALPPRFCPPSKLYAPPPPTPTPRLFHDRRPSVTRQGSLLSMPPFPPALAPTHCLQGSNKLCCLVTQNAPFPFALFSMEKMRIFQRPVSSILLRSTFGPVGRNGEGRGEGGRGCKTGKRREKTRGATRKGARRRRHKKKVEQKIGRLGERRRRKF